MFDTHCHLNFSRFKKNVDEVVNNAKNAGITGIVIPGTDIESSKKAIEIAEKYDWIYAAVGIHPHHVFELSGKLDTDISHSMGVLPSVRTTQVVRNGYLRFPFLEKLEELISHPKVVAIGECGLDRHEYRNTKYEAYQVGEDFIELQKQILEAQIDLAIKHKKSLILHNREAKADMLPVLEKKWHESLNGRTVFHCCEPDQELLDFASLHHMFIGVDGDLTYTPEKQEFIKKVPLEILVLETDSPFLLPEPLKSEKKYPNEPKNIPLIAELVAKLKGISIEEVVKKTTDNATKLFQLSQSKIA